MSYVALLRTTPHTSTLILSKSSISSSYWTRSLVAEKMNLPLGSRLSFISLASGRSTVTYILSDLWAHFTWWCRLQTQTRFIFVIHVHMYDTYLCFQYDKRKNAKILFSEQAINKKKRIKSGFWWVFQWKCPEPIVHVELKKLNINLKIEGTNKIEKRKSDTTTAMENEAHEWIILRMRILQHFIFLFFYMNDVHG